MEPTTGTSVFLELPSLNSHTFQRWLDGFGAACPALYNLVVLDKSAFHKAKAVQRPGKAAWGKLEQVQYPSFPTSTAEVS